MTAAAGVPRSLGERAVEIGDDEEPPGARRGPAIAATRRSGDSDAAARRGSVKA